MHDAGQNTICILRLLLGQTGRQGEQVEGGRPVESWTCGRAIGLNRLVLA